MNKKYLYRKRLVIAIIGLFIFINLSPCIYGYFSAFKNTHYFYDSINKNAIHIGNSTHIVSNNIISDQIVIYSDAYYDGWLKTLGSTYSDVHDLVIAYEINTTMDTLHLGQLFQDGSWRIYRSYLFFNTTNIPVNAEIIHVEMHIYGHSKMNYNPYIMAFFDFDMLYPNMPLLKGDFDLDLYNNSNAGKYYFSSLLHHYWTWNQDSYDLINRGGWTKIMITTEDDYNGDVSKTDSYLSIYSSDKGGERRPYLEINYEYENSPPNIPNIPSGDISGFVDHSYEYSTSTTDLDGDKIQYYYDWGDENGDWTGFVISGENAFFDHVWRETGIYEVKVKARDEHNAESDWSESLLVTIDKETNNKPNKPKLEGEKNGKTGERYTYSANSTDPDGNDIEYYLWDWGDGVDRRTKKYGPFNSGEEIFVEHIWDEDGSYEIYVWAQDVNGAISYPSDPLLVNMPKNQIFNNEQYWFFNKISGFYQLLELILQNLWRII